MEVENVGKENKEKNRTNVQRGFTLTTTFCVNQKKGTKHKIKSTNVIRVHLK